MAAVRAAAGQKEMLLPISGKRAGKNRGKERQAGGVESTETSMAPPSLQYVWRACAMVLGQRRALASN
jgi:hypothetical protein